MVELIEASSMEDEVAVGGGMGVVEAEEGDLQVGQ